MLPEQPAIARTGTRSRIGRSRRAMGVGRPFYAGSSRPGPFALARRPNPCLPGPARYLCGLPTVAVAQLVRAPDCGSGGRGFESPQSPQFPDRLRRTGNGEPLLRFGERLSFARATGRPEGEPLSLARASFDAEWGEAAGLREVWGGPRRRGGRFPLVARYSSGETGPSSGSASPELSVPSAASSSSGSRAQRSFSSFPRISWIRAAFSIDGS